MVLSTPLCSVCKRPMHGASSSARFCSTACAETTPDTPKKTTLNETLTRWRKRATDEPGTPDTTVTHWTQTAVNHFTQAEHAARLTPPLPTPGDETCFPCPSCNEPLVVQSVIGPAHDSSIIVVCPHCGLKETPRTP